MQREDQRAFGFKRSTLTISRGTSHVTNRTSTLDRTRTIVLALWRGSPTPKVKAPVHGELLFVDNAQVQDRLTYQ